MADSNTPQTDALARVLTLLDARVSGEQASVLREFVTQYYAGIAEEDLARMDTADLYGLN